jgi:AraC-like DNA-binding protein
MPGFRSEPLPILLGGGRFRDFDQFQESTRGWDLDFRQLDRGALDAQLLQVGFGPLVLMLVSFNRRFDQRGGAPPGLRTFALPEECSGDIDWCGHTVSGANLNSFSRGGEFHAVSPPRFEVHTVSVAEEALDEVARTLGVAVPRPLLEGTSRAARCDPEAVTEFRGLLRRVCQVAAEDPSRLRSRTLQEELNFEIPAKLLGALAHSSGPLPELPFGARAAALRRAVPYIEEHRDRALPVREVCQAAGVSWRTLDYAFRERFGVTPKAYLTALRLDGVRRELVPTTPPIKVSDVANHWGFWHMGQFAADYRRQFGELPSETLRRRGGARSVRDGHSDG